MLAPAPISAKVSRSRKDPVAAAIAAAATVGVRWRWRGAELIWDGLDRLPDPDRALLEKMRPEIEDRLRDPTEADPEWPLSALEIEAELITDPARAAEVIAGLPQVCGLDTETMARPEHGVTPTWLVTTKSGGLAVRQLRPRDKTALDPRRACIRLIQVYAPSRKTAFVFEWAVLVNHNLVSQLLARSSWYTTRSLISRC
jgi:hypothetical protein